MAMQIKLVVVAVELSPPSPYHYLYMLQSRAVQSSRVICGLYLFRSTFGARCEQDMNFY